MTVLATVAAVVGRLMAAPPPTDPLGPVAQDPEVVRQQACKIVADLPAQCEPAKPAKPPPEVHLDWLGILLWVVFIALVLVLIWLLVRAIMRYGGGGKRSARKGEDLDDLDVVERGAVAVDRSREPTNWRAEAEEHRRAGRYRDALRCRYRALVGDLARRGLIDEIPGRTTGEERAQLRRVQPDASRPFNAAADLFDGAWYGHADVGAADDDRFQSLEHDVLGPAGSRR